MMLILITIKLLIVAKAVKLETMKLMVIMTV